MTLEEALLYHAVEAEMLKQYKKVNEIILGTEGYERALQEHIQLAEWLKELAERRKQPEIIRCKDCKNWKAQVKDIKGDGLGCCIFHKANFVTGEGYCYWAERRTDV